MTKQGYLLEDEASGLRNHIENELKTLTEQLDVLWNYSADAAFLVDHAGDILKINPTFKTMFGLTEEEIVGKNPPYSIIPPSEKAEQEEIVGRLVQGEVIHYYETKRQRKDKSLIDVLASYYPVRDRDGTVIAFTALYKDITPQKLAQAERDQNRQRYQELAEKYRSVVENVQEIIYQTDAQGRWVFLNRAWTDIMGFDVNDSMGKRLHEYVYPDDRGISGDVREELMSGKPFVNCEIRAVTKDGKTKWFDVFVQAVKDNAGNFVGTTGILHDVTDRNRTQEIIRNMAYFDGLTGLPNRASFSERLASAIEIARGSADSLCVMFLDLDRFKIVNDSLGHDTGDLLLKSVSDRMRATLPQSASVFRFGGDELTLLATGIRDQADAEEIAQDILDAVSGSSFVVGEHEFFVTVSIGISLYPSDGDEGNTLVKNADIAMYRAKHAGGNQYRLYDSTMNEGTTSRFTLEKHLHRALEREEFEIHYQPKFNPHENTIVGLEALIRWNHPELGRISPADFIPLAEETGLIVPIGEWVLRTACLQMREWCDKGYGNLRVAVNLSARQFQRPDELVRKVQQTVQDTGIVPNWLELEITESLLMNLSKQTFDALDALRNLGVKLSVDDFGTGYSSLSYLKRFPIDYLKIDKTFIDDLPVETGRGTMTSAIITLGHSLGLKVVAEGVETVEQLEYLRQFRCDEIQGYVFAKPLPASEIEPFILAAHASKG